LVSPGRYRDADQDQEGALRALEQSALLAPSYAKPNWQLGNRCSEWASSIKHSWNSEGSTGRPKHSAVIIDLAWDFRSTITEGFRDAPTGKRFRLASRSRFSLAKHNQSAAAAQQFLLNKGTSDPRAEVLLDELLKTRAFNDAYQVWARMRDVPATSSGKHIFDGGF